MTIGLKKLGGPCNPFLSFHRGCTPAFFPAAHPHTFSGKNQFKISQGKEDACHFSNKAICKKPENSTLKRTGSYPESATIELFAKPMQTASASPELKQLTGTVS